VALWPFKRCVYAWSTQYKQRLLWLSQCDGAARLVIQMRTVNLRMAAALDRLETKLLAEVHCGDTESSVRAQFALRGRYAIGDSNIFGLTSIPR